MSVPLELDIAGYVKLCALDIVNCSFEGNLIPSTVPVLFYVLNLMTKCPVVLKVAIIWMAKQDLII